MKIAYGSTVVNAQRKGNENNRLNGSSGYCKTT